MNGNGNGNTMSVQSLRQRLKQMQRNYAIKLQENRVAQQKTVLHIRRLKKVRRKLNEICDNYGIMLRDDFHKGTIKSCDSKTKLLKNTIRKDMLYYIDDINERLSLQRKRFHARSAEARQIKKDLAWLSQILDR